MSTSTRPPRSPLAFEPAHDASRVDARPAAPRGPSATRLPSLDGLRAVAIALVIAWHVAGLHVGLGLNQLWRIDAGNLGVRTFFVISGFLITTLLLDEHRATGTIGLRRFYFRRTFRIIPAFYTFLAAMWMAGAAGWQHLAPDAVLHAATFTSNYLRTDWPVGHSWSLSVEEQFYLLWPGVLVLFGLRGGMRAALGMLFIAPALRTAAQLLGHWPDNPRYSFECVAGALAMGSLLARYRGELWAWPRYRRLLTSRLAQAWPVAVLAAAAVTARWPLLGAAVGITTLNVLLAFGIDRAVRVPGDFVGRALNARPVALVGTLSYSLYLWQQPFLNEHLRLAVPLRLLGIAACAAASYYAVERPALRWRGRLERRLFAR